MDVTSLKNEALS